MYVKGEYPRCVQKRLLIDVDEEVSRSRELVCGWLWLWKKEGGRRVGGYVLTRSRESKQRGEGRLLYAEGRHKDLGSESTSLSGPPNEEEIWQVTHGMISCESCWKGESERMGPRYAVAWEHGMGCNMDFCLLAFNFFSPDRSSVTPTLAPQAFHPSTLLARADAPASTLRPKYLPALR